MPGQLTQNDDDNIWIASSDGRIDDVEFYLKSGIPVDASDEFGYTPLHAASSYGYIDLIELLVNQYGANVNIQDTDGDTPLHVAETVETAKFLVELGADPSMRNSNGILPIENAYTDKLNDVVEFLKLYTPEFEKIEEYDKEGELEYVLDDEVVAYMQREFGVSVSQSADALEE